MAFFKSMDWWSWWSNLEKIKPPRNPIDVALQQYAEDVFILFESRKKQLEQLLLRVISLIIRPTTIFFKFLCKNQRIKRRDANVCMIVHVNQVKQVVFNIFFPFLQNGSFASIINSA